MHAKTRQEGFTLLEVMIAMSVLVVGATSILSIFVAAISFHTKRKEENRITQIYNYAREHAEIAFNNYDPSKAREGEPRLPKPILADFTDYAQAVQSLDAHIREGVEKFPGFKYEITFEEHPFAVQGSSVVANIRVYRLSGQAVEELISKEFLTRSGTPVHEFFRSPSMAERDRERESDRRDRRR